MTDLRFYTHVTELASALSDFISGRKAFILTDENVHATCVQLLLQEMNDDEIDIIELEPGEISKSIDISTQIWETLMENEAGRDAVLINIGGGVVCDLGGFVASTYKRGIEFIHLPTSLLAMVDAAHGGKTGIDHLGIKNVIGSFAPAHAVMICSEFLSTLPERELLCGLAEMFKHGIVADKNHWYALSQLQAGDDIGIDLIKESVRIKQTICAEDPTEKGIRKILNFGHTIGHAIESASLSDQEPILHGEAVALGMLVESELANRMGLLSSADRDAIHEVVTCFFPPEKFEIPGYEGIRKFLFQDKKNKDGEILFALPDAPGSCKYNIRSDENSIAEAYRILMNE